jgi:hypothetical protein
MLSLLAIAAAYGQQTYDFDATLFRPSLDARYTQWTDDTSVAPDETFTAGWNFGYANDPVVFVLRDETRLLVSDVVNMDP